LPVLSIAASLAVLLTPRPALAVAFGFGLEGGFSETHLTNFQSLPEFGLILEQRFELPVIELTLWEDVEPIEVFDGGWAFLPIALGLRAGLGGGLFKPYAGILANDNLNIGKDPGCGCGQAAGEVVGLGGDLGVDVPVAFLRFGLELRGYGTLSPPVSGIKGAGEGVVLQALLSVRAFIGN
jgi:hypothetical protein